MRKPDVWATVRQLAQWHHATQIGARRNALVACTELAQRRREREDVELFLSRARSAAEMSTPRNPRTAAGNGLRHTSTHPG
jgi:hypothetical protein